jgi:hypothetical protein
MCCGDAANPPRETNVPTLHGLQSVEMANEVENRMRVRLLLRERSCDFSGANPGAPAVRSACGRAEKAREGWVRCKNPHHSLLSRYLGAAKPMEATGQQPD